MMNVPDKKLGFGFMRLPILDPDKQTAIDQKQVEKMVDLFIERGFTYCDTAWMYHDFASEEAVGKAVADRHDRSSFTIASKMPDMMLKSADEVGKIYEAQKKKLHVDFFDYYLMHNMNHENVKKAEEFGAIDFVRKKREEGEIRCLGFSCHDTPEYLDEILTKYPFFEFVQLQINYLDWNSSDVRARECYETAVKHGKKVIVMEPVKGGKLANPPEKVRNMMSQMHADWSPASWAIRFAASLPEVLVVLSGMSTIAQVEENTDYMQHFVPLNDKENAMLLQAAEIIRQSVAIPCTSCRYCIEANHCPMNLLIPEYFALYNARYMYGLSGRSYETKRYQELLKQGYGKASGCVSCHGCEKVCPQHIRIPDWMKKVAADLEN